MNPIVTLLLYAMAILGFVAFRAGWIDHLYVRPQCQRGSGCGQWRRSRRCACRQP